MTLIIHKDDDFTNGSPVYGTNLCLYLGCSPSLSAGPGNMSPFRKGNIHSGYYNSFNLAEVAASTGPSSESTVQNNSPRGFVYRPPSSNANVDVKLTSGMLPLGGVPTFENFVGMGCIARMGGGTLVEDGTRWQRYDDCNCYMALMVDNGDSTNVLFALVRVNTGTYTTLDSQTVAGATLPNIFSPLVCDLSVSGTGGTVTLTADFSGLGSPVGVSLSATDTSGSRITTAGRQGFFIGRDREPTSGIKIADVAMSFQIDENGSTTVLDDFTRYQIAGARDTVDDQFGNTGDSLQMSYYWDLFTGGAPVDQRIERDGGNNRIRWIPEAGDVNDDYRVMFSSRPATDPRSQHRSAVLNISQQPAAGNVISGGIVLHGSQPNPVTGNPQDVPGFPNGTGYAAECEVNNLVTYPTWYVRRWVNGTSTILARFIDTGSTHWPGFTTNFTMDFEVRPKNSSQPNGPVEIILEIDSTQVVLAAPAGGFPSGVSVDANGTLTDLSSSRVTSGSGEGILFYNSSQETSAVLRIDDWTEETLTGVDIPDEEQDSVVLNDEGSSMGTLDGVIDPDYVWEARHEYHSILHPMESGHRETTPRFTTTGGVGIKRRRYSFSKVGATSTEFSSFLSFIQDRDVSVEAFTFTTPDDATSVVVHIVEDSIEMQLIAPNAYAITAFELEEIL